MKTHADKKQWWEEVKQIRYRTYEGPHAKLEAKLAEKLLLHKFCPPYNVKHTRKKLNLEMFDINLAAVNWQSHEVPEAKITKIDLIIGCFMQGQDDVLVKVLKSA